MTSLKRINKKGAPDWLHVREGARSTTYYVRYRRDGIEFEKRIPGKFNNWTEARADGKRLLMEANLAIPDARRPIELIRTEDLCRELVLISTGKAKATHEQTEMFFRKHIIPYVNEYAPYAHDLNATHWERYKTMKRLDNPKVALFNHWKFFVMLFNYTAKKEIIRLTKLDFNEAREDFRERGNVIPDEELDAIIANATSVWKDRITIQRRTGMRPGEARNLLKDRYDFTTKTISLKKEDTKNRKARSFAVDDEIHEILVRRASNSDSPHFFPSKTDPKKPMDRCLTGWENALMRAGIHKNYTPHDIRHTWLTKMFQSKLAPALICYIAGLSIEEAEKTYLHFNAEDTRAAFNELTMLTKSLKVDKT